MKIARLAYISVIFLIGLGVGVVWSPIARLRAHDHRTPSSLQSEDKEYLAKVTELCGKEAGEFASQFEDLTIRIKKGPFYAWASKDGRFTISLHRTHEIIASELTYPGKGGEGLVRYYSYCSKSGGEYNCSFERSVDDSNMKSILFDFSNKEKTRFVYLDSDGDGLWDRFTDSIHKPPTTYIREGLGWKWKELPNVPTSNSAGEADHGGSDQPRHAP